MNQAELDALLATQRLKAALEGKEAFSLTGLAEHLDLSWRAERERGITRDVKFAHYEFKYYVTFPEVKTLAQFAEVIRELRQWESE